MKTGATTLAWVKSFAGDGMPLYLQIVGFMEQGISDETLRPGDRLPPQRLLADHLQVDLTTVTRAYAEARRRNLLEARGAAGTFVSAPKVDLAQVIDLSMNIPPPPVGVDLDDFLKRGVSQVLMRSDVDLLMTYHLGGGSSADRAAAALWLAPMLGTLDHERIVVCPGAQAALAALVLALSDSGDVILTEPLVYPGLLAAANQVGRRVMALDVDQDGVLPDSLEAMHRRHGARLLYLNPTLQNPSTRTMPQARREALAEVAERLDIRIIEDDPYWLFDNNAPTPLAALAPRQVFYVATLSKCLVPGLRTAYVVMPERAPTRGRAQVSGPQEAFMAALRSFVLMSAPLMTSLATQWIHDGTAAALFAGIREEADARRQLADKTLGNALATAGGIHLWQALPRQWAAFDFAASARVEGLNVIASDSFYVGRNTAPPNIRIALGRARSRFELVVALRRLAELLNRHAPGQRAVVV